MNTDELLQRIERKPGVLGGKPVIKGTRLSVEHILSVLASGGTETELLDEYPGLATEDIKACLSYASAELAKQGAAPAAGH